MHRNRSGAEVSMLHHSNTSHAFIPSRGWLWCLTGLENGKQVVKRTGVVGHKSLSTKRLWWSLLETSNFKALLIYHFLTYHHSHFLAATLSFFILAILHRAPPFFTAWLFLSRYHIFCKLYNSSCFLCCRKKKAYKQMWRYYFY